MKNLLTYTILIIVLFYIFGCLMFASFNIILWNKDDRTLLFSLALATTLMFSFFYYLNDSEENDKIRY